MPFKKQNRSSLAPGDGNPENETASGDGSSNRSRSRSRQSQQPKNKGTSSSWGHKFKSFFSREKQQSLSGNSSQTSFVGPGILHQPQLPALPAGPQLESSPSRSEGRLVQAIHESTPTRSAATSVAIATIDINTPQSLNCLQLTDPPSLEPPSQQGFASPPGFGIGGPTSHYSAPSASEKASTPPSAGHEACTTLAIPQTNPTSNSQPTSSASQASGITQEKATQDRFASVWAATLQIANRQLTKNKLPTLDPQIFARESAEENIKSVITQLEAAQGDNQKKRWRYKWCGQEIIVIERWGKILRVVEKYSKIGEVAIQHSPQVSSLVWASAKMILQVALNHIDTIECLEATIATIVEKIARCEFYAKIYMGVQMPTNSHNHKTLDSALPQLYAAVIVFAIKAEDYYTTGWPKNIGNMLKPYDVEIKPFVDEINVREDVMRECADEATMERIREMEGMLRDMISGLGILNDIATTVNEHRKETTTLKNTVENERIHELLMQLSPLEPLKRHQDIKSNRLPNTGMWLLQLACFIEWSNTEIQEKNHILCCYGIPGAGKTYMSSLVIDDLNSRFGQASEIGIACLYADYRDQTNQTVVHILGSILHQLVSCNNLAHVPPEITSKLDDIKKQRTKAGSDDILAMLNLLLPQLKFAFLCIDALDELELQTRRQLFTVLKLLLSKNKICIFFTGRHPIQSEVRTHFPVTQLYEIELNANPDDIERYIIQEINNDSDVDSASMDAALKNDIVMKIVAQAEGMFLLPALHIRMVLARPTKRARRQALDTLPNSLYETFEGVVERVQKTERYAELGMKIFMWLHLAYRPLQVTELEHALAVKEDDTELDTEGLPSRKMLLDSCFGLVIVDEETSSVRFVHYSLEEYFRQHSSKYFPNGCSTAAGICLTYLNFVQVAPACVTKGDLVGRVRDFPFLEYAACTWAKYYSRQSNITIKESALKLLGGGTHEWTSCPTGLQVLYGSFQEIPFDFKYYSLSDSDTYVASRFVGIHVAACFGLGDIAKFLLETGEADVRDHTERTALSWAASQGHHPIVKLLLARDDVEADAKSEDGQTPLSFAAQNGHEAVVKLLLARDDVEADAWNYYGRTPLSVAAQNGHEAVVKLLLARHDVNVNLNCRSLYLSDKNRTPLSFAAGNGHEAVVKLLLARDDVEADAKSKDGQTPLSFAAQIGHEAVVKLLLARDDVEADAKSKDGQTPLLFAAKEGHEAVVKLLLARDDVNVNAKCKHWPWGPDGTPLSFAAQNGHEAVVKLLLARDDVEADAKNNDGRTPLLFAARNGHEAVVKLLLARDDVEADAWNYYGRTPLSVAAQNGHEAVVKLLLARDDVEADAKSKDGQTPLSFAAENGHEAVVKLLLARDDVEADAKSKDGQTPLSFAAQIGHEAVVKLLLARDDVNVNAKCKHWLWDTDGTPLSFAAQNGHEAVVKLLLARDDVDANAKSKYGQTPLSFAAENGHEAVVKLLLARDDVEADARTNYGQTPLSFAAENGHEAVVKLLLARDDVEADAKSKDGRTPLLFAARNGHEAVVKLLLARDDVDADAKSEDGRTPLSFAAEKDQERLVKLLLARDGVNVNTQSTDGKTPLSFAAENGHGAVVKLLLARGGVEADAKSEDGWTPLSFAAQNGHEAVVKLLLARDDVNVNAKCKHWLWDTDGTPLSFAAQNGHEAVVKLLLARDDVDANAKSKYGQTPLSFAAENGHEAVVKLLLARDDVTADEKSKYG